MNSPPDQLLPAALRAAGRVTGLAMLMLVVALVVGQGLPDLLTLPTPVALEFALLLVMIAGIVAAWRWERAGSLATLAAVAGFNVVELATNRRPAGPAFLLFAIPAALHLLAAALRRRATPPPGPARGA
jgi:hypothetical protein